jgi:hypothetical protein
MGAMSDAIHGLPPQDGLDIMGVRFASGCRLPLHGRVSRNSKCLHTERVLGDGLARVCDHRPAVHQVSRNSKGFAIL